MASTIDALAVYHPVVSFSLNVARGPGVFDRWVNHIDRQLDERGATRAAVIGVSFGGLVAIRYAAEHPDRVTHLVLVSTPSPAPPADARTNGTCGTPEVHSHFSASVPRPGWFLRLSPRFRRGVRGRRSVCVI